MFPADFPAGGEIRRGGVLKNQGRAAADGAGAGAAERQGFSGDGAASGVGGGAPPGDSVSRSDRNYLIWRPWRLSGVVLTAGLSAALLSGLAHWMDGGNFSGLNKLIPNFQEV